MVKGGSLSGMVSLLMGSRLKGCGEGCGEGGALVDGVARVKGCGEGGALVDGVARLKGCGEGRGSCVLNTLGHINGYDNQQSC